MLCRSGIGTLHLGQKKLMFRLKAPGSVATNPKKKIQISHVHVAWMCFWFAETHNAIILVLQLGCLPIGKKADFLFLFYSLVKHWNFGVFYKLIKQWLTLWDGGLPDPIESVLDWLGMRLGPLNNWQENSDFKIRRKDSFMLTSNHINNNDRPIYTILSKFGGAN